MSEAKHTSLPWVEKHRPGKLSDIVSHEATLATINKFISENCLPHLLFYGPPGTGKTTTAEAIAFELYGKNYGPMVLELNASDDRGIDVVRERIKRFASTKVIFGSGFKLIILDESDAMTGEAQAALRRIMEKFSSNVRFIMICNYPEKIIPALRSRCTEFRFPPLPEEAAKQFLQSVAQAEDLTISPDGIQALIRLGSGDLRRSVNLMQTTALSSKEITTTTVYKCSGYPLPEDIEKIMDTLMKLNLAQSLEELENYRNENGVSLLDVVRELHLQIKRMTLAPHILAHMIDTLARIEKRIAEGASDKIQSAAIGAAFQKLRSEVSV